jgi:hypothetical protein
MGAILAHILFYLYPSPLIALMARGLQLRDGLIYHQIATKELDRDLNSNMMISTFNFFPMCKKCK